MNATKMTPTKVLKWPVATESAQGYHGLAESISSIKSISSTKSILPASSTKVQSRGFSLVELLVVLAILSLMGAIAIPAFSRMGLFSDNATRTSARQLFTLMKAAQVYASTYRVDTALAYRVSLKSDSINTAQQVAVIDAVAMVRKIRPEEVSDFDFVEIRDPLDPQGIRTIRKRVKEDGYSVVGKFVLVSDREGVVTPFERGAALLLNTTERIAKSGLIGREVFQKTVEPGSPGEVGVWTQVRNAKDVSLGTDQWGNPIVFTTKMPAHVFKPNGIIPGGDGSRMRLEIGPAPDALPEERFVDAAYSQEVMPYTIYLYPTMGRLKISFGEST